MNLQRLYCPIEGFQFHPMVVVALVRCWVPAAHYSVAKAYMGSKLFVFSDQLEEPEQSATPLIERGLQTLRS